MKILHQCTHSPDRPECWAAAQTLAIEGQTTPAVIRGLILFMLTSSRLSIQQRAIHLLSQLSKASVSVEVSIFFNEMFRTAHAINRIYLTACIFLLMAVIKLDF